MNRTSTFEVRLSKVVCGGNRNINAYYIVLKADKPAAKLISRAMRIDEDNEDELGGEVEVKPSLLELWNYDKMKLVDRYKVDFKSNPRFTATIFEENLELTVERRNEWEQEMRKRKQDEESGSHLRQSGQIPPKSEAVSSKLTSNSPSKIVKGSQQSKKIEMGLQALPPNPKRVNDSIAKLTPKSGSEIQIEEISMVEY